MRKTVQQPNLTDTQPVRVRFQGSMSSQRPHSQGWLGQHCTPPRVQLAAQVDTTTHAPRGEQARAFQRPRPGDQVQTCPTARPGPTQLLVRERMARHTPNRQTRRLSSRGCCPEPKRMHQHGPLQAQSIHSSQTSPSRRRWHRREKLHLCVLRWTLFVARDSLERESHCISAFCDGPSSLQGIVWSHCIRAHSTLIPAPCCIRAPTGIDRRIRAPRGCSPRWRRSSAAAASCRAAGTAQSRCCAPRNGSSGRSTAARCRAGSRASHRRSGRCCARSGSTCTAAAR